MLVYDDSKPDGTPRKLLNCVFMYLIGLLSKAKFVEVKKFTYNNFENRFSYE